MASQTVEWVIVDTAFGNIDTAKNEDSPENKGYGDGFMQHEIREDCACNRVDIRKHRDFTCLNFGKSPTKTRVGYSSAKYRAVDNADISPEINVLIECGIDAEVIGGKREEGQRTDDKRPEGEIEDIMTGKKNPADKSPNHCAKGRDHQKHVTDNCPVRPLEDERFQNDSENADRTDSHAKCFAFGNNFSEEKRRDEKYDDRLGRGDDGCVY